MLNARAKRRAQLAAQQKQDLDNINTIFSEMRNRLKTTFHGSQKGDQFLYPTHCVQGLHCEFQCLQFHTLCEREILKTKFKYENDLKFYSKSKTATSFTRQLHELLSVVPKDLTAILQNYCFTQDAIKRFLLRSSDTFIYEIIRCGPERGGGCRPWTLYRCAIAEDSATKTATPQEHRPAMIHDDALQDVEILCSHCKQPAILDAVDLKAAVFYWSFIALHANHVNASGMVFHFSCLTNMKIPLNQFYRRRRDLAHSSEHLMHTLWLALTSEFFNVL